MKEEAKDHEVHKKMLNLHKNKQLIKKALRDLKEFLNISPNDINLSLKHRQKVENNILFKQNVDFTRTKML